MKPKVKVEILAGNTRKKRKNYPVKGNTIIIEKPAKGRGKTGWTPTFTPSSFFYYHTFGVLRRKLVVKEGATSCIDFGADPVNVPSVDLETVKGYFEALVIKNAGATTQKIQVPLLLYLLVGLTFALSLITFLMQQGKP